MFELANLKIKKLNRNSKFEIRNSKWGFTLVEILIASLIFSVVMMVAIGAIMTIQNADRKAQSIRAVIDNLNLSLETMTRKIRMGSQYQCRGWSGSNENYDVSLPVIAEEIQKQSCSLASGGVSQWGTGLYFLSTEDTFTESASGGDTDIPTAYRWVCYNKSTTQNELPVTSSLGGSCPNGPGRIMYYKHGVTGNSYELLTDPQVDIQDLKFYVRQTTQPSILITIKGQVVIPKGNIVTPFNIETTVSQYLREQ